MLHETTVVQRADTADEWLLDRFDNSGAWRGCYTRRIFDLIDDDDNWHAAVSWPDPPYGHDLDAAWPMPGELREYR